MTTNHGDAHRWQRERYWLGHAGLAPFVLCVAVLMFSHDGEWRLLASDLLRYYAALIASFLGAVHWGAAADPRDALRHARLRWGVMPALIAWPLLMLPPAYAFGGFTVLFTLILGVDRYLLPILDDAYRGLRLRLTIIVVICLVAATAATST